jgi:hypothetical protein
MGFFFFDPVFHLQGALHVEGDVFNLVVELRRDQSRRVCIEHLVDGRHHTHAHQFFDHVPGLYAHLA